MNTKWYFFFLLRDLLGAEEYITKAIKGDAQFHDELFTHVADAYFIKYESIHFITCLLMYLQRVDQSIFVGL